MAIQIINCPSCGTFLLEDTAECHACGHILNAHLAATTKRRSLPTDQAVDEDMDVCVNCGESCRKGLVRCWNCGSFTRPDIAEAHRQRSEVSQPEMDNRFDLPVLDATSVTETDSMTRRVQSAPEYSTNAPPLAREENDDSDDFELSEEIHLSDGDDSFDLGDNIQLRSDDETLAPVFSLQPIEPLSPPAYMPLPEISSAVDDSMSTIPLLAPETPQVGSTSIPTIPLLESPQTSVSAGPPQETGSIPLMTPATSEPTKTAPASKSAAESPKVLSPEDELLKIAADEEAEISNLRKEIRFKDTFVVFCPQGHRIRVRERFRGKTGKCPKCESVFVVPAKQAVKSKKKTDVEFATVGGDPNAIVGRYTRWLTDIHLHNVFPEKLKLVPDSLLNDFQSVDVGFSGNEILIVTLVAAGGLFGGAAKKKPAIRTAMLEYFSKPDASPDGLTAASKLAISKDTFPQLVLAQPVPIGTESLFANVLIFGIGRIAVRLPRKPDDRQTQYLSFSLSEFRVFAYAMQSICGFESFGSNADIPLTDQYDTYKCHFGETPVLALRHTEYYVKDPILKLEINGWKCSTCGLVISESGRLKEKIGGANGRAIAKAPCPKCKQKLGNNPLFRIPEQPAAPAESPAPVEA